MGETADDRPAIDDETEDIVRRLQRQGLKVSASDLAPLIDHHRRSTAALRALRAHLDGLDVEPLDAPLDRADGHNG